MQRSNNGKKRKQEAEKEVTNKKVKLVDQENKASNYQAEQDNFSNVEIKDTSSTSSSKADTPWIEMSLTKLNQNDRDEIIRNKDVSDRIVESAQTILRTQFPGIYGVQSTLLSRILKIWNKKIKIWFKYYIAVTSNLKIGLLFQQSIARKEMLIGMTAYKRNWTKKASSNFAR